MKGPGGPRSKVAGRTPNPEPRAPSPELESIREQIETLDGELLNLLARRVELALEAGSVKRAAGLSTLDPSHEAAVVRRAAESARELGLPEEDVRHLFWQLVGMCRRAQRERE